MKREQLKTILLVLLVVSSLMLSLAIWNHQPDFELAGNDGNLVDPQIQSGNRLTRADVLKPIYLLYHRPFIEKPIGLKDKLVEEELFQRIRTYSLYNFASFHLNEDWTEEFDGRVEFAFSTDIPTEAIYDLFTVDSEALIPNGTFNRIDILLNHDGYHLMFRNEQDNRVIGAKLQNYPHEIDHLIRYLSEEDYVTYEIYQSSRGTNIYLPNENDSNVLLFSYTDIPIDPFRNFLFSTPSIVRSARTAGGNTTFIDGTRELILESNHLSFTNQINEQRVSDEQLSHYDLFEQVQNFVNTHNGFTFNSPFNYFLSELSITPQTNRVEFTLSYQGIPIFSDPELANISVTWHNHEVYQYQHPLITLVEQRGVARESTRLIDAEDVIRILRSEIYQRTAIYDVILGYQVREQVSGQGQVYELIPTWYVKGINGWSPLIIPTEIRGGEQ